jgi:hypothetical protein
MMSLNTYVMLLIRLSYMLDVHIKRYCYKNEKLS